MFSGATVETQVVFKIAQHSVCIYIYIYIYEYMYVYIYIYIYMGRLTPVPSVSCSMQRRWPLAAKYIVEKRLIFLAKSTSIEWSLMKFLF